MEENEAEILTRAAVLMIALGERVDVGDDDGGVRELEAESGTKTMTARG